MNKTILIAVIAVIVVGAGTFFAGMKYQQSLRTTSFRQQTANGRTGGQFQGNGNGARMGLRPVSGEIISADDKSITVKLADGSSKIVIFSNTTEINKASKVGKEELKAGEKVAVFGTQNSDGSVTAQNIQLNPIIRTPSNSQ